MDIEDRRKLIQGYENRIKSLKNKISALRSQLDRMALSKNSKPASIPRALQPYSHRLKEAHILSYPPCIYFLITGNEVSYVGQSTSLQTRIHAHRANKSFERVLVLPVERKDLREMEAEFIDLLKPQYNLASGYSLFASRSHIVARYLGFA